MALQSECLQNLADAGSQVPSHLNYATQLFETGLFSDCTIYAGSRRWQLHRAILAQRCDFFRACFSSGFRESCYNQQTGSAEINMNEDEPSALGRMLKWLYTLQYPAIESTPALSDQHRQDMGAKSGLPSNFWTSELALLVVADKYDLTILADQACASICNTAAQCSWNVAEANSEDFPGSLDDFVDMLELLYLDISSGSASARRLQEELLGRSAMMIAAQALRHTRLSQLVTGVPELAKDVVEALRQTVEAHQREKTVEPTLSTISTSRPRHGRSPRISGPWMVYRSGSESSGSGRSPSRAASRTPTPTKPHIPMNEDSDLD